jgi:hypothetical protein
MFDIDVIDAVFRFTHANTVDASPVSCWPTRRRRD